MYIRKFNVSVYLTDRASFIAQLNHKDYVTEKARKIDLIIPGKERVIVGINIDLARQSNVLLDNFKGVEYE